MIAERYQCNICQHYIETSLNGDINGITLAMIGPAHNPSEMMVVQENPGNGKVHICGRCCLGLHGAIKDLKVTMFAMVER